MGDKNNQNKAPWWQPSLLLFYRLSGWIGGPIIIALFVGKWLDKKYNTEPWLFLFSIGVAFVVSMIGITKDTMNELKKIEKKSKMKEQDDSESQKN